MNRRGPAPPPLIKRDWIPPGPVALRFLRSDALMCGIRGPFGSGKSTTCIVKLITNLNKQRKGPDGMVRRRTAIIRNNYPELKTTTIKSWHDWVPSSIGKWTAQGPPTHVITTADTEWEVVFVALDEVRDLQKLLSMDLSDAWINEAREIPKAIVDGLTGRVGRYPRTIRDAQGKVVFTCAAPQILMDSNPPDTDHWWAKMADFPDAEVLERNAMLTEQLRAIELLHPKQKLSEFFSQPSGRSPDAENLRNLIPGYYERLMADKSTDWIKVYVDGQYGFVQEGKPVYPEYVDSTHCQDFELMRGQPIYIGIDFGRTPAATFGQRTPMGAWRIHSEITTEDMGAIEFGQLLQRWTREKYEGMRIEAITGDPAGIAQSQADDNTPFLALRAAGVDAKPASTNDPMIRRETFASFLRKMIDGKPGMMIHPQCQKLRKALAGGYHYSRVQTHVGTEIYTEKPVKDGSSHVAESAQYLLLGAGEARTVMRASPEFGRDRPDFADMNYVPEGWR